MDDDKKIEPPSGKQRLTESLNLNVGASKEPLQLVSRKEPIQLVPRDEGGFAGSMPVSVGPSVRPTGQALEPKNQTEPPPAKDQEKK